ncbi:MAG: hypothetical protein ACUVWO_01495 [Thermodesulfobacteriota bacterium]
MASYGAIYGSFAALPLLLGWIQPSRTIEGITLKHALDANEQHGRNAPHPPSEEAQKISRYLNEISETIEKSPANVELRNI